MKLTGVILDCFLPREEADTFADGVLTVTWEPDEMNSTAVVINGQYYSEGAISLKVGDAIRLEIPSGFWEGKIMEVNPPGIYSFPYLIRVMDVVWEGKYAGLAGGLSGLFRWQVFDLNGLVETSAYPSSPVPFRVYAAAHAAADCGDFFGRPEARRRALGQIIETIMSWADWDEEEVFGMRFQVIEDNGGGLHLAVFGDDECIYYASGLEHLPVADVQEMLQALRDGANPVDDGWESNLLEGYTPQQMYKNLTGYQYGYGWQIIADDAGVYPERMGAAGRYVFG